MKRFNYSLLCSAMALAACTANAATYEVVDIGGVDQTRHSFALGVNGNGDVVGISREHFNFPIDFDHLDMDAIELDINVKKQTNPELYADVSFERVQNRDLNAATLDYLFSYLTNQSTNYTVQKIGNQTAFQTSNGFLSELNLFDAVDESIGDFTRSTFDQVNAINDDGWSVSSATDKMVYTSYTPDATETTPEPEAVNIWSKGFADRKGVVSDGVNKTVIQSPEILFGGTSYLTDISNSKFVVGYAAIGFSVNGATALENCTALTDSVNQMRCAISVRNEFIKNKQRFYKYRAFRWTLDDTMAVIEEQTKQLELLFTPKESDLRTHLSAAYGVNEVGHVVGYSDGFRKPSDFDNDNSTREVATYYDGATVREFIDQEKDSDRNSRAVDVNDNNIAVGYVEKFKNFDFIKRMFVYNADTDTVTYPNGFFSSSETVAAAVNNHNKVVGTAEVENTVGQTRRQRGFIYDISSDTITDLNKLISCNNPYTIAEAKDINDDGVIVGTAIKTVEKRDSLGAIIVDDNGEPVMEAVARAVKLIPIADGSVEDCNTNDAGDVITYERKGAGFGVFATLGLLLLAGMRRLIR